MTGDDKRRRLEEFDALSPAERAAATAAHYARPGTIITNLEDLPDALRARAIATAERLAGEHTRAE